jgi:hypothetical protein
MTAIAKRAHELDRSVGAPILELFIFVCRLAVILAFMSPAILMNLASLKSRGDIMCYASVALVIGAAVGLHRAIHSKGISERGFFLLMAPVLVFMSMFTAIRNVGGLRETASEARQDQKDAKAESKAKLADLTKRRKAQADVAGEDSLKVIEARIEALKAKSIHKWNATNGCQPDQVASSEAKTLCSGLLDLKTKLEAAKERDRLQALIDGWEAKPETAQISTPLGVPVSNEALIHALDKAGFKMDGSEIDYAYEAGFVLALELIAAGGPLMVGFRLPELRRRIEIEAPKPRSLASRPRAPVSKPKPEPKPAADGGTIIPFPPLARLASLVSGVLAKRKEADPAHLPGSADDFRWRHFEITDDPNDRIEAGEVQKRYAAECARLRVEKMKPDAFCKDLQKLVEYVRTPGGRRYYYGVKWRDVPLPAAAPKVAQGPRVVIDNTASPAASSVAAAWG